MLSTEYATGIIMEALQQIKNTMVLIKINHIRSTFPQKMSTIYIQCVAFCLSNQLPPESETIQHKSVDTITTL